MNEKNKLIGKMEQPPIIEITAGKAIEYSTENTEIGFRSESLDMNHLQKIYSLLERRGYDSNNIALTSKEISRQIIAHRDENRKCVIDGMKAIFGYTLKCDKLDEETIKEVKEVIEGFPSANFPRIYLPKTVINAE
jgi:hypothetical protein